MVKFTAARCDKAASVLRTRDAGRSTIDQLAAHAVACVGRRLLWQLFVGARSRVVLREHPGEGLESQRLVWAHLDVLEQLGEFFVRQAFTERRKHVSKIGEHDFSVRVLEGLVNFAHDVLRCLC
eukprot:Amastigsp_a678767_45.p5 type:complete len:124 gc:universal Amastigsp_a678767_45:610-239(-)